MPIVEMRDHHWSAESKAVVVLLVDRSHVVEVPFGVEKVIAIHLEDISVKPICPRGQLVDGYALRQTILRREGSTLHAGLIHHLIGRIEERLVTLRLSLYHGNPVEDG